MLHKLGITVNSFWIFNFRDKRLKKANPSAIALQMPAQPGTNRSLTGTGI
jgi:hypothetical protein